MVFSGTVFIFLFLPMVLGGYYIINPRYRNAFLLLSSLAFYAYGEPRFVLVMVLSILVNYSIALLMDMRSEKGIRKSFLIIGVVINLSLLFVFKYVNFVTSTLKSVAPRITVTSFSLPIGISFFTFQAMSYLIDVYRGETAQRNPLNIGLYISFFPQLVAGPIVRYKEIAEQIKSREISWEEFSAGVNAFLRGLTKKIIFANNMAIIADKAFSGEVWTHGILFSWLGALAYTLQIYFDFSGYSDMAIGLGKMMGFHFPKNFDYPYSAASITDFWRRWHISLSSWFRDYVYIPLGGSQGGKWKHVRNLLVVWLLTGIWHGANWTFILWGLLYFVLLTVEKYCIRPELFSRKAIKWAYRAFVFLAVMVCWIVFRSDSVRVAGQYIKTMVGAYGNPLVDNDWLFYSREYAVLILFAILLSTPVIRKGIKTIEKRIPMLYSVVRGVVYIGLFLLCISYLVIGAHNPFIYFNF